MLLLQTFVLHTSAARAFAMKLTHNSITFVTKFAYSLKDNSVSGMQSCDKKRRFYGITLRFGAFVFVRFENGTQKIRTRIKKGKYSAAHRSGKTFLSRDNNPRDKSSVSINVNSARAA